MIEKHSSVVATTLPTKPGFYITAYVNPDVFELVSDGYWYHGDVPIPKAQVPHDSGNQLRRLEPVSETVKKVLNRVQDWGYDEDRMPIADFMEKVYREFGGTE